MANALRDNVWRLDTADSNNLTDETQFIEGIVVTGAGAADRVVIENGNGDPVFDAKVATAGDTLFFDLKVRLLKGFSVPTLTAGLVVFLYGRLD